MERKVGEIFEYEGKVYQVVEIKTDVNCKGCAFEFDGCDIPFLGDCHPVYRTDKVSIIFKEVKKHMEIKNNQLTIDIPEGHIIDVEHSDLSKGIIKFKKNDITYKDIEDALNLEKDLTGVACNINNVTKLSAIDKLINIANYYNKGWKPDWSNNNKIKFYIAFDTDLSFYEVRSGYIMACGIVYFKNRKDAQAVIDNPNFREILDTIYKN